MAGYTQRGIWYRDIPGVEGRFNKRESASFDWMHLILWPAILFVPINTLAKRYSHTKYNFSVIFPMLTPGTICVIRLSAYLTL